LWAVRRLLNASRRGQSLVEFALILPMLLVLLLGIADFGRVFAAGITIEAAARDAAEAVAQEYLRNPPAPMDQPAPLSNDPYYQNLHDLAARTACREARTLPNTTFATDVCASMPIIMICVHDNADPLCDEPAFNVSLPGNSPCSDLLDPPVNAMQGGAEPSRYVEVRVCYRFSTLFNLSELRLPLGWGLSVGDIYLQKARVFTVGFYPPPPTPVPPPPPSQPPEATLEPTPVPTDSPTPTPLPTDTPTPLPTDTPTPEPPTPEPPTPEPLPTDSPTPTPDPTP
jgi:TadE-like protein